MRREVTLYLLEAKEATKILLKARFVARTARGRARHVGLPQQDVVQAAALGLVESSGPTHTWTYREQRAVWRVRNAIAQERLQHRSRDEEYIEGRELGATKAAEQHRRVAECFDHHTSTERLEAVVAFREVYEGLDPIDRQIVVLRLAGRVNGEIGLQLSMRKEEVGWRLHAIHARLREAFGIEEE